MKLLIIFLVIAIIIFSLLFYLLKRSYKLVYRPEDLVDPNLPVWLLMVEHFGKKVYLLDIGKCKARTFLESSTPLRIYNDASSENPVVVLFGIEKKMTTLSRVRQEVGEFFLITPQRYLELLDSHEKLLLETRNSIEEIKTLLSEVNERIASNM